MSIYTIYIKRDVFKKTIIKEKKKDIPYNYIP